MQALKALWDKAEHGASEKVKAEIGYFRLNVLLSVELLSNERLSGSHLLIKMPVGEVTGI